MHTLKVKEQEFVLNIGDELTVKDMRIIYPLTKQYADNEVEMVIAFFKAFSDDKDIENKINEMSIEDFSILAEQIAGIINQKKN